MKISAFLVIILLALNACAMNGGYVRGPFPSYKNLSDKPIYDIKAKSGNINLIGWPTLGPGLSASASNDIKNKNDMYGDVIVNWKNAAGKECTRTFKFTEEDWKDSPNLIRKSRNGEVKNIKVGAFIVFEFTQNNVEYYTSAAPDYWERGKRAEKIMSAIRLKIAKEKEQ